MHGRIFFGIPFGEKSLPNRICQMPYYTILPPLPLPEWLGSIHWIDGGSPRFNLQYFLRACNVELTPQVFSEPYDMGLYKKGAKRVFLQMNNYINADIEFQSAKVRLLSSSQDVFRSNVPSALRHHQCSNFKCVLSNKRSNHQRRHI